MPTRNSSTQKSKLKRTLSQFKENVCTECSKVFKTKDEFDIHIVEHNTLPEIIEHVCRECSKFFQTKDEFDKHIVEHSTSSKKTENVCTECNKVFKNKDELDEHKVEHSTSPPHKKSKNNDVDNVVEVENQMDLIEGATLEEIEEEMPLAGFNSGLLLNEKPGVTQPPKAKMPEVEVGK